MSWGTKGRSDTGPCTAGVDMSQEEYATLANLIKSQAGIHLGANKITLLKSRLSKRLRLLGLASYGEYMRMLRDDRSGTELAELIDAISTNVTSFFRQPNHFSVLANEVLPEVIRQQAAGQKKLRIWSAACSSGEEPYSIAIQLQESLPHIKTWDAKILATDISGEILERAMDGVYEQSKLEDVPQAIRARYFTNASGHRPGLVEVSDTLRSLIGFGHINLMGKWPMKGPFHAIFCRNVMIYFDKPTQEKLVQRFHQLLAPGGTLFIGHSENLTGVTHNFRNVGPAIYRKN